MASKRTHLRDIFDANAHPHSNGFSTVTHHLPDRCGVEILRTVVGSTVHGLAVEGQDDRDEMGVFVERPENVLGLGNVDHYTHRTQPEGERSGPGDLDLVSYSLRKFCRLASKGNPSILVPLFVPEEYLVVRTPLGDRLRDLAPAFAHSGAGYRFLGYMRSQIERWEGKRGNKNVNRPELVAKYGHDVKYASHAVRLGLQGIEYVKTGRLTLPMPEDERRLVRSIRTGQKTEKEALGWARTVQSILEDAIEHSDLPPEPDRAAIDSFCIGAFYQTWGGR